MALRVVAAARKRSIPFPLRFSLNEVWLTDLIPDRTKEPRPFSNVTDWHCMLNEVQIYGG